MKAFIITIPEEGDITVTKNGNWEMDENNKAFKALAAAMQGIENTFDIDNVRTFNSAGEEI